MLGNTALHLALESGNGSTAVLLIEAGADRDRVSFFFFGCNYLVVCWAFADVCWVGMKPNTDDQTPEQIAGLGGREQKKVLEFVWSKVGRPEQ